MAHVCLRVQSRTAERIKRALRIDQRRCALWTPDTGHPQALFATGGETREEPVLCIVSERAILFDMVKDDVGAATQQ